MEDVERTTRSKTKIIIVSVIVALAAVAGGSAAYIYHQSTLVNAITNAQHQLTQISYHGHNGTDALTLLKQHANVATKRYSFGDLVTSINGSAGNGPKYWTFYINGKQADIGAGSYKTKDSDVLMWRLQ